VKWRQVVAWAGVATVLAFLIAGATGALHGAPASAGRSALGAVATVVSPSQTSGPAPSCAYSGPLGGLNAGEAVGVLVVIALAGMVGGIAIGRRFLNPQPLPPGIYAPGSHPSGGGAGKITEETWTEGGKTAGDQVATSAPGGQTTSGGGSGRVSAVRKAGGGNTPGQESSEMEGESKV